MKFVPENHSGIRIHGYEVGLVRLAVPAAMVTPDLDIDTESGLYHACRSIVLGRRRIISDWAPQGFAELESAHFEPVLELEPELVLLGTGAVLRFPGSGIMASLYGAGIGVEVMDTAAACRTFNILSGEGREVVAALLMIEK